MGFDRRLIAGLPDAQHGDRDRHVADRTSDAGDGCDLGGEGEGEAVALDQRLAAETLCAGHQDRRREQTLRRDVRA